jgi:hypothetical protein
MRQILQSLFLTFLLLICIPVKADYVLAFHLPDSMCQPCREMKPVEAALLTKGCDIRLVDAQDPKNAALVAYYKVRPVPVYIYVISTAKGDFDSGHRLLGPQSEKVLHQFCISPGLAKVSSVARRLIDAVFDPYTPYVYRTW